MHDLFKHRSAIAARAVLPFSRQLLGTGLTPLDINVRKEIQKGTQKEGIRQAFLAQVQKGPKRRAKRRASSGLSRAGSKKGPKGGPKGGNAGNSVGGKGFVQNWDSGLIELGNTPTDTTVQTKGLGDS